MLVGVRELKTHLSDLLKRAASGEDIVVTDHGRPVVRLTPYVDDDEVDRGIEEGWIEAPRRSGLATVTPTRSERSTLEVLAEDRG